MQIAVNARLKFLVCFFKYRAAAAAAAFDTAGVVWLSRIALKWLIALNMTPSLSPPSRPFLNKNRAVYSLSCSLVSYFVILCAKNRTDTLIIYSGARHIFACHSSEVCMGMKNFDMTLAKPAQQAPILVHKLLICSWSRTPLSSRTKEKFLGESSRILRQTNPSTSNFLIELDSKGGSIFVEFVVVIFYALFYLRWTWLGSMRKAQK